MPNSEKALIWEQHIARQKASGLTIQRWCQENDISPHQFYYWKSKRQLSAEVTRASFTELRDESKSTLFFECKGVRLYIDPSCDLCFLKRCLQALREILC
jgi:transposase-like protein